MNISKKIFFDVVCVSDLQIELDTHNLSGGAV
ncbi:MAG: hypothetical protein ACD_62C00176G0012 [uncultured bacterium]|nr:MAG: hypothetical protein ACD_62C00176G0012 [uncultured bacterium]